MRHIRFRNARRSIFRLIVLLIIIITAGAAFLELRLRPVIGCISSLQAKSLATTEIAETVTDILQSSGIGAEERGQGQAIAENLMEMMTLKTPVLTIVIGEGGSGGALALAVADEVWMLENSVYSVISPEGCASILWKDSSKAPQAAEALRMTAQDLFDLRVIERIIRQPRADDQAMFESLKLLVSRTFEKNLALDTAELTEQRYARFRRIGAIG